jgi:hypothetical protein
MPVVSTESHVIAPNIRYTGVEMGTVVSAAVLLLSLPLFSFMFSDLFFVSFGDEDCDAEQWLVPNERYYFLVIPTNYLRDLTQFQ